MKKIIIKNYFSRITRLIIAIFMLGAMISFLLVFNDYQENSKRPDYKKAKVNVNEALSYIESNFKEINNPRNITELNNILQKNKLQVQVLDFNGETIYNSINTSKSQGKINLKYINLESKNTINYISPIVINEKLVGNAIFSIAKETSSDNNLFFYFIPLILGVLIAILLLFKMNLFIRKYVLSPIQDLNIFTDNISKGKYMNKLNYEIDSEITRLCSGFELMQGELQYSIKQQNKFEKERKELIVCISHDMRTPLASIKAYIEAIKDGFAKDTVTLNNYIQIIDNKADNILKLVNDFFEHSKAELGELRINKAPQYSGEFFMKIIEDYRIEFHNKGINLVIDTGLPEVLINIDVLRMEQVIFNLLQNAMKYTSSGGSVHFGVHLEKEFLKLYIKDTGRGIPSMDLPYIFDKFYRGEKEELTEYQDGTGLGLYVCKYIVEAHGGEISAESKLQQGTTIYFTIPKI